MRWAVLALARRRIAVGARAEARDRLRDVVAQRADRLVPRLHHRRGAVAVRTLRVARLARGADAAAGALADDPARGHLDLAVGRALEAEDVDRYGPVEVRADGPREHVDVVGAEGRAQVLRDDAPDARAERLGPAVARRELELRRGDTRRELRAIEVARHADRAEPERHAVDAGSLGAIGDGAQREEARRV